MLRSMHGFLIAPATWLSTLVQYNDTEDLDKYSTLTLSRVPCDVCQRGTRFVEP